MIYAIQAVGTQYIKFGKANSVGKRLNQLETCCPHDLHIEAVADWPDAEERKIHEYLKECLVRREWFTQCEKTAQIVQMMRDREMGLKNWRKAYQSLQSLKVSAEASQPCQPKNSKPSSITQSKSTDAAFQFMQSLMDWESSTLRSIANSLNTKKPSGEMLKSPEH